MAKESAAGVIFQRPSVDGKNVSPALDPLAHSVPSSLADTEHTADEDTFRASRARNRLRSKALDRRAGMCKNIPFHSIPFHFILGPSEFGVDDSHFNCSVAWNDAANRTPPGFRKMND